MHGNRDFQSPDCTSELTTSALMEDDLRVMLDGLPMDRKMGRNLNKLCRKSHLEMKPEIEEIEPFLEHSDVLNNGTCNRPEGSNNNTNIHVNPHVEMHTRACDINANVTPATPATPPVQSSRTWPPVAADHSSDHSADFQPNVGIGRLPDVADGCSFRMLYHGSLEIDEVHEDLSASGGWKFRSKKNMIEEAVVKLKVGPLLGLIYFSR